MSALFRGRPVEAVQFDGSNAEAIEALINRACPDAVISYMPADADRLRFFETMTNSGRGGINWLLAAGDWVVGLPGAPFTMSDSAFQAAYDPV